MAERFSHCGCLYPAGNGAPSSNWGDGFASQPAVLALFPTCDISDPGPVFFDPLLTRPYLSQVIGLHLVLTLCTV